jgi:hypothetical protein
MGQNETEGRSGHTSDSFTICEFNELRRESDMPKRQNGRRRNSSEERGNGGPYTTTIILYK